ELSSLMTGMNQYKEGGKGSDRQIYLQFWDCESVEIDRKSNLDGIPLRVHRPFVGIVGTIQPKTLRLLSEDAGRALDDGFLDRFLFSYPEPRPDTEESWREVSKATAEGWNNAVKRLLDLNMEFADDTGERRPRVVGLDDEGKEAWRRFTRAHSNEVNSGL